MQTASGSRQPLGPYKLWIPTPSISMQHLDPYSLWTHTASGSKQPLDPKSLWIQAASGSSQVPNQWTKRLDFEAYHFLHPIPKLRMNGGINLFPPYAFMMCVSSHLPLPFIIQNEPASESKQSAGSLKHEDFRSS
jgi:hypothetical protein